MVISLSFLPFFTAILPCRSRHAASPSASHRLPRPRCGPRRWNDAGGVEAGAGGAHGDRGGGAAAGAAWQAAGGDNWGRCEGRVINLFKTILEIYLVNQRWQWKIIYSK